MSIAVAIATHQRQQPLGIVLRELPADWHACVVVTDAADAAAIEALDRPNTHIGYAANAPLGAKWQAAVRLARALKPEHLVITGSDDVVRWSTAYLQLTMQGVDFAGLRTWLAFDGQRYYRLSYRPHVPLPLGAGRVYGAALLERMNWRLFDLPRNRWLDEFGYMRALACGATVRVEDALPGLDLISLKGDWAMKNPLDKMLRGRGVEVQPIPTPPGLPHYPITHTPLHPPHHEQGAPPAVQAL